jgi:hypothetical protein
MGRYLRGWDRNGANEQPDDRVARVSIAGIDTTCSARATTRPRNAAAALYSGRWRSAMPAGLCRVLGHRRLRNHRAEWATIGHAADGAGRRGVFSTGTSAVSAWGDVTIGCAMPAERGCAAAPRSIAATRAQQRAEEISGALMTTTAADIFHRRRRSWSDWGRSPSISS